MKNIRSFLCTITQHADLFVNCLPYVHHILNHFVDNRIIFQEPAVHFLCTILCNKLKTVAFSKGCVWWKGSLSMVWLRERMLKCHCGIFHDYNLQYVISSACFENWPSPTKNRGLTHFCDTDYQWVAVGRWFSPVSTPNISIKFAFAHARHPACWFICKLFTLCSG
jgi:hypothetical protein